MGGGDGVGGGWGAAAEASFAWEPEVEAHATLEEQVEAGQVEDRGLTMERPAVQVCLDGLQRGLQLLQMDSNCSKWRHSDRTTTDLIGASLKELGYGW